MKTKYAALPFLVPMLAAFGAAPAFAQTTNPAIGAIGPANPPAASATQTRTANQPASSDAQFVKEASAGNMAEVKLGDLAMQRGETPAVREFGRWMVTDHTMAENMLQGIGQHVNLPLSTAPTAAQQATAQKLDGVHGAQFDRDYIDAMVQDHRMTVQKFETVSQSGQNGDLKNYTSELLPALKQHLAEAEDLQKLGNRYSYATPGRDSDRGAMHGDTAAGDTAVARLNQAALNRAEKTNP